MKLVELLDSTHLLYSSFLELYSISFPIFEQRLASQQEYAFSQDQYHLLCYTEQEHFIGFISYWEFEQYIYIEHLAICDDRRGKGYGGRLLNEFVEQQSKIVLLEIDPVVDELSKKRLRFYTHHGFYTNEYVHDHPAYRLNYPAHRLVVLSHGRRLSPKEYTTFAYELQSVVMKCSAQ